MELLAENKTDPNIIAHAGESIFIALYGGSESEASIKTRFDTNASGNWRVRRSLTWPFYLQPEIRNVPFLPSVLPGSNLAWFLTWTGKMGLEGKFKRTWASSNYYGSRTVKFTNNIIQVHKKLELPVDAE